MSLLTMKATSQKKTINKLDLITEKKNHFCFPSLVKYFGGPPSHGEGEASGRGLSRNTRDCQPRNRAPRSPARPYLCGCAEIYAAKRSHPPPPPHCGGRVFSQPNFSERIIVIFFSPSIQED